MLKSVLLRFVRGAIGGAVASMVMVTFSQPTTWHGFLPILSALGISAVYGSIVGLLLALDKWASWSNTPTVSGEDV